MNRLMKWLIDHRIKRLIKKLRSVYWDVRMRAVWFLGYTGDPRAIEPLIGALKDRDSAVREAAANALVSVGDTRAITDLTNILWAADENSTTRKAAVNALASIRDKRAVIALSNTLLFPEANSTVRKAAMNALAGIRDKRAITAFCNALKKGNFFIRRDAIEALDKIGNSRAIELLINVLKTDDDPMIKEKAAKALGKINDIRVVESLIHALKYPSFGVRMEAAKAIGAIGDAMAVMPLIKQLEEDVPIVQEKLAEALGKIGDTRAVEPLISLLNNKDIYYSARIKFAQTLGKIGDPRAVVSLTNALKDENPHVQEEAVAALGKIADARAVAPIIHWLKSQKGYFYYPSFKKCTKKALKKICKANPVRHHIAFCKKCSCKGKKHTSRISLFKRYKYYFCRKCQGTINLITGLNKVVLLLAFNFEENFTQKGKILIINYLKQKEPFDFDEIQVKDANDFDVDRLVMKLRNDMDDYRRKRLSSVPVFLSPGLNLSQAKVNMLNDNFKIIVED